jgi:hypothetical protein
VAEGSRWKTAWSVAWRSASPPWGSPRESATPWASASLVYEYDGGALLRPPIGVGRCDLSIFGEFAESLGHARNPYISVEGASDQLTGRILAGLRINLPEFAVSYPDFVPIG